MDSKTIAFRIKGAKNIEIVKAGDLVMTTALGVLRQNKPQAYQEVNGRRQTVETN